MKNTKKILNQDEMDMLLRGIDEDVVAEEVTRSVHDVMPLDFTARFEGEAQFPLLSIIHGRFAQICAAKLGVILRKRFSLRLLSTQSLSFSEYTHSLTEPSHCIVFCMGAVPTGNGMILTDRNFFFTVLELLFGAQHASLEYQDRAFTHIEELVVDRVRQLVLHSLEEAWLPAAALQFNFVRMETQAQLTGIAMPDELVLVSIFEAELENSIASMAICLPYSCIIPARHFLAQASFAQPERRDADWLGLLGRGVQDTPIEAVVRLGGTRLPVKQVLALKAGDTLPLDTSVDDLLDVTVGGVRKYQAKPGIRNNRRAVQIVKKE